MTACFVPHLHDFRILVQITLQRTRLTPCACVLNGAKQKLVLVGETVTKECHPGRRACRCDCPAHTANSNVSSNTWCTRKNLCVPRNWEFLHATHILDVIMLKYPLKVRPIPGIWVQSVPVTAIPWGGMNTEQRNTLHRSVRQDD